MHSLPRLCVLSGARRLVAVENECNLWCYVVVYDDFFVNAFILLRKNALLGADKPRSALSGED